MVGGSVLSVLGRKSFISPGVRFGSSAPLAPGVMGIRQVLATMIEKGRPLVLPEVSLLPPSIKPVFELGVQAISPQRLESIKNQGAFGVGEEASDILYYLGIKAMMVSGVFSQGRADMFAKNVQQLLSAGTPEAFERIHDLARQSITDADAQAMKPYFPLKSPDADRLLKAYLEMGLVDNAVWGSFVGTRGQLYRLERADAKIAEETQELGEHLQRLNGPDISGLLSLLHPLDSEKAFNTCFKALESLGVQTLKTPDLNFDNLLRFAIIKSSGRTEAQYLNRTMPYADLKAQAKAWEKVLEAYVFLQRV